MGVRIGLNSLGESCRTCLNSKPNIGLFKSLLKFLSPPFSFEEGVGGCQRDFELCFEDKCTYSSKDAK